MPIVHPPSPYPTRKQMLTLLRDTLDRKPEAIKLLASLFQEFTTPTLQYIRALITQVVQTRLNQNESPE